MENNIFIDLAEKETKGSPVLVNRTKISTADLIQKWPDGVTVTEFDMLSNGEGSAFPVLAFAENDSLCFFGGAVLSNIVESWINAFNGDVQRASDSLKSSGGVKMRLYSSKNKKGQSLTKVEILK